MKKSKELYISNSEESAAEALQMADEFIAEQDMERRKSIRLRLIAEETIGMVRAMAGDFQALFWMERDGDSYSVKLVAKTEMDREKKRELIGVSTSGKNAIVKGFMGKVGEIIENGLLNFDDVMKLHQEYGGGYVDYAFMGFAMPGEQPMVGEPLTWSLNSYKEQLEDASETDEPAKEAWDELEKSIVANIAQDVLVGVKKDHVEMTIKL